MNVEIVKPGIKTNLVTGFMGAGKTTCILQLLEQKPANERWAILVNEFGETGIDGAILQGAAADIVLVNKTDLSTDADDNFTADYFRDHAAHISRAQEAQESRMEIGDKAVSDALNIHAELMSMIGRRSSGQNPNK